jgi:hypothetical protein
LGLRAAPPDTISRSPDHRSAKGKVYRMRQFLR